MDQKKVLKEGGEERNVGRFGSNEGWKILIQSIGTSLLLTQSECNVTIIDPN